MGFIKEIIAFFKNYENLHFLWLILPPLTFYINNKNILFIISLILAMILFVYRLDLKNKTNLIIQGRIKTKRKNRPLFGHWKNVINDARIEFSRYMFGWWFFGIVNSIFIGLYIYSTIISFRYSLILFGAHLAIATFVIFLSLVINHNIRFNMKKKSKRNKK